MNKKLKSILNQAKKTGYVKNPKDVKPKTKVKNNCLTSTLEFYKLNNELDTDKPFWQLCEAETIEEAEELYKKLW